MRTIAGFVLLMVTLLAQACACESTSRRILPGDATADSGGNGDFDSSTDGPRRDGNFYESLPSVDPCSPGCGPEELCDDGLDNDCDGVINEDCSCTPGETRPCFEGPPDRRALGVCSSGVMSCGEFGWGSCLGSVGPSDEVCDGQDNDCNGGTDDGLTGCAPRVQCPSGGRTLPLNRYALRGSNIYSGSDVTSWTWDFRCPASVPDSLCPNPTNPSVSDTEVYITASGVYQVDVQIAFADGSTSSCAWPVFAEGGGLRVELNWDTMGEVDMDLHLHRWTSDDLETGFFQNANDCYYNNCTVNTAPDTNDFPDWGLASTSVENCSGAPRGAGAAWQAVGSCRNPRLDIDNRSCFPELTNVDSDSFCAPENINVDQPVLGRPYRVFVDYYRGLMPTHPTINIFCGGQIRGVFGTNPSVTMDAYEDSWYVADVVFVAGECGADCVVYPVDQLAVSGVSSNTYTTFGPPWSCQYSAALGTCTPR